jgi:flagellar protein FlgJ
LDLQTAERLISASDPKGLSALKKQSSDPAAAKAVAGQFGAMLMQGMMQGSDGDTIAMAGGGVGSNVVSSLFASTISQAAASGDKLGLADALFRSIEAKQHLATAGSQQIQAASAVAVAPHSSPVPASVPPSSAGFPLTPYWQVNGSRPLAKTGKAGDVVSHEAVSPTNGWPAPPSMTTSTDAGGPRATSAAQVQAFSEQLTPLLKEAGRQLGVSPKILLAQAALETGWGRSVVGNNVFGIKAGSFWLGSDVTTMTHEVEGGHTVSRQASFRAYPSLDAAVQDYVALVGGSPRYQPAIGVGNDAAAYGRGLVAGGYATDPEYARKLEAIAASQPVSAAFGAPDQPLGLRPFAAPG